MKQLRDQKCLSQLYKHLQNSTFKNNKSNLAMEYTIPKGLFDILPEDPDTKNAWKNVSKWQHVESIIRKTCELYNFKEIRTPIFEKTELFIRGVGEASDIVSKEMYTFLDKGERSMTLRPEGTASVIRAYLEHKLYNTSGPHKFFYIAPMFRYERPQAGRYRQHHQFGAEALGLEAPEQDAELIDLACQVYKQLGIGNLIVAINSVGDSQSRTSYKAALKKHLEAHFNQLSEDSKLRFEKNVLRILDSKDPQDQQLLENAPSILDYLSSKDKIHFDSVCSCLMKMGIHVQIAPRLVRGLDYYSKTVFEILSPDLGAQSSIGGGGRYDGLTQIMGGPFIPSVGFGTGLERILQAMDRQNLSFPSPKGPLVFFIPLGDDARGFSFSMAAELRHKGVEVEIDLSGKKVQHGIQLAIHSNAEYCVVIGEDEIQSNLVALKHLNSRTVEQIALPDLQAKLLAKRSTYA